MLFDAADHLYETRDALTKFLPERFREAIKYVEIEGRTKIVVRGQISEFIPNPTFERVAAQELKRLFPVWQPRGQASP